MDEVDFKPISRLIRYDGVVETPLVTGIAVTNALAFSPRWPADVPRRQPHADDLALCCATPRRARSARARSSPTVGDDEGVPDGACLDAEGGLWSARYGGGAVQRYLPDGTADIRIAVPASKVTCCCFGGEALDRL